MVLTDELDDTRPVDDILRSLSDEELAKVVPISKEEIIRALRQGYEEMKSCEPALYARKGFYF